MQDASRLSAEDLRGLEAGARTGAASRGVASEGIVEIVELLYFAYRDFTGEADALLARHGFGRAHHRALYFVNRHPGLPIAELLDILKITKQSLSRVLKELIAGGFIEQRPGANDRRQRLLYATATGSELARTLTELQVQRIHAALNSLCERDEAVVRAFLAAMVSDADRQRVLALINTRA
ncbi:MAG: MarR family winged helix-turn-helix transcriptional regulator [Hyphomicrobiaceae bacterium]